MIYYTPPNIAAETQAQSVYPNNVYLPLNTGRTTAPQAQNLGRGIDERPSKSIELTGWINTSIRMRRVIPNVLPIKTISAAYTANPLADANFIVSSSATITLPDPAPHVGWVFSVRSLAGVTTTLDPTGSIQIDGATTTTVAAGATGTFTTDGVAYYKIS